MIRIVVCIDVDTDLVADAYRQTRDVMDASNLEWESSDEWFDTDGDLGDPDILQAARMKVFAET